MYTSKLKIKTSSVNVWRSLCWWPGLSYCLVTSSISQVRPQKKPADRNCWDDSEARREDLSWQSEGVVWRRHRIQTGRGRRGTGVLGCADSWTPWGWAWMRHLLTTQNIQFSGCTRTSHRHMLCINYARCVWHIKQVKLQRNMHLINSTPDCWHVTIITDPHQSHTDS